MGLLHWIAGLAVASASDILSQTTLQEIEKALVQSTEHEAPVIDALGDPVPTPDATYTPVVILHGLGDSGSNPGMKSICATVPKRYPGLYTVCSDVADGTASIITRLDKQVEEFRAKVLADPKLAFGFNAVGLSQGNLVVRGYIQKYNVPRVRKFISICGPQEGEGACPNNILYKAICPLWKISPYNAPVAFSDYWKDVSNKDTYLAKNRWLADANNEKSTKNATYRENMIKLEKYVLVEALKDTIVEPHASESHGFWEWGSKPKENKVLKMVDTDGYKGDWIGLKTLDQAKKIDFHTYIGDHLRFSSAFWNSTILPYLGNE